MTHSLKNHKKVKRAKKLLQEALSEYQKNIHDVQKPKAHLVKSFKRSMDSLAKLRGRPLFFPYIGSGVGNGALVELADGSIKYDFITGIGVHYMGHSHSKILNF